MPASAALPLAAEKAIRDLLPELEWAIQASKETVNWAATLNFPDFEQEYEFVALNRLDEYAIYDGDILSSHGERITPPEFENHYTELHVRHSNALHSHTVKSGTYFVGPLARFNLNFKKLRQAARASARENGLKPPISNPYKGMLARAVELVHICDLAVELAQQLSPPRSQPRGVQYHPRRRLWGIRSAARTALSPLCCR
jgi:coenzyme F420-reducing hydrogenase alpha subunit